MEADQQILDNLTINDILRVLEKYWILLECDTAYDPNVDVGRCSLKFLHKSKNAEVMMGKTFFFDQGHVCMFNTSLTLNGNWIPDFFMHHNIYTPNKKFTGDYREYQGVPGNRFDMKMSELIKLGTELKYKEQPRNKK